MHRMKHMHISVLMAIAVFLMNLAVAGTVRMFALSRPTSKWAQAYLAVNG